MTLDNIITLKDFLRERERIAENIQSEIYGHIPTRPIHVNVEVISEIKTAFGKRVTRTEYRLFAETERGIFSFPFIAYVPYSEKPIPAFVHIDSDEPDSLLPIEEIVDRNFALFSFSASDIADDNKSLRGCAARILFENRKRRSAPGKIAAWAFTAMRVMDFISTLDSIDRDSIAVIGHSILADAALLAGCFDERFKFVISNDSATSLLFCGERESFMSTYKNAPLWFCPSFAARLRAGKALSYDRNLLFALCAPRVLIIGNAEDGAHPDSERERRSLCSLNRVYSLYGKRGISEFPATDNRSYSIFYHLRSGAPFLGRAAVNAYMDIILRYINENA